MPWRLIFYLIKLVNLRWGVGDSFWKKIFLSKSHFWKCMFTKINLFFVQKLPFSVIAASKYFIFIWEKYLHCLIILIIFSKRYLFCFLGGCFFVFRLLLLIMFLCFFFFFSFSLWGLNLKHVITCFHRQFCIIKINRISPLRIQKKNGMG